MTYPLKPLLLLMGDAVVVAEFSVDNVKSVTSIKIYTHEQQQKTSVKKKT